MPFPLNHRTKRLSIGFSATGAPAATLAELAAYAVPMELNMDVRGGRPIAIRAPAAVIPLSSDRRDVLTRSVIICDTLEISWALGVVEAHWRQEILSAPLKTL